MDRRLRLVVLTTSVIYFSGEHISLTEINNNHFQEIRDSFPKYFENRKQTNLKLDTFRFLMDFCPQIVLMNIHEYVNELICIYYL